MKTMQLPDAEIAATVTSRKMIELPGSDTDDEAVREILSRGNVPLLIGDNILAEVANQELNEGLEASAALSHSELANISAGLAENIRNSLTDGDVMGDAAEIAADAAALFVLCLRRGDVLDVSKLPACSVIFDGTSNEARLTVAG